MNCDRCGTTTAMPWSDRSTLEWLCNTCANGWCFEPCRACRRPVRVCDADWTHIVADSGRQTPWRTRPRHVNQCVLHTSFDIRRTAA